MDSQALRRWERSCRVVPHEGLLRNSTMDVIRACLSGTHESPIEDALLDGDCPQFFAVDWREDDADVVEYCADCLPNETFSAEWRETGW